MAKIVVDIRVYSFIFEIFFFLFKFTLLFAFIFTFTLFFAFLVKFTLFFAFLFKSTIFPTFILIMISAAELTEGSPNSKLEPDHEKDEDNAEDATPSRHLQNSLLMLQAHVAVHSPLIRSRPALPF